MKPPGRTTLARMQRTALLEAERIEISQDARVHAGLIEEPMPEQVEKRDDFAGMVNLIDAIQSDQLIMDRLKERIKAQAALRATPVADAEDVEIEGDEA